MRHWLAKFGNAFRGLRAGVRGQSSFLVHGVIGGLVTAVAFALRLPPIDGCMLLFAIGLVLVAELFNSSIEWLARGLAPGHDERIGRALDIASGAVLVASLFAALIGLLVLGPPLWRALGFA
ncbi:MAG: diacylglycerol kinase family protein [Planctomycetes bacterium]|nr:diacylglycerol kinase family protein [Planctomycetota bacterium]